MLHSQQFGCCHLFPLPEPGTARRDGNGRVTHQLGNSREGPALRPPPSREAEVILEIRQYYIASYCSDMFILEMELLLPSPPRRSRGLPVTPHLGARSSPAGHLLLPLPRSPGRGGQEGFVCPGREARNTARPLLATFEGKQPRRRGWSPLRGAAALTCGGGAAALSQAEPNQAGTSRSKPSRAEPNRTELKQTEPSRTVPRPLLAWREPPPRRYLGRPRGRSAAGRGGGPRGAAIASGWENVPATSRSCRAYRAFRTGWDCHQ